MQLPQRSQDCTSCVSADRVFFEQIHHPDARDDYIDGATVWGKNFAYGGGGEYVAVGDGEVGREGGGEDAFREEEGGELGGGACD